ncbi:hypothetical protein BKA70DRAFT_1238156 [Coprinopsis sp. MPI-PUGE-AT-0042]|nr:hypothetical protein BKA70DRAFT_1238156 [Coprinopsis sp. MPI-PUGE-AT-0042]
MVNGKEQEKERKPRIVPPDTQLMTPGIQSQPSSEGGDLWAISGQGKEKENERKPRIVPTDTWPRVPGNSKLTILRGWTQCTKYSMHENYIYTLRAGGHPSPDGIKESVLVYLRRAGSAVFDRPVRGQRTGL